MHLQSYYHRFKPVNTTLNILEKFSKGKGIESEKIACVDVRFQKKGLIIVYGNQRFLKWACATEKNQLMQFRSKRFMPETFENPEGLFFENVIILW